MERRNTFGKEEHLCGKTTVDELYKVGESFFLYPFRVVYQKVGQEPVPVQCLVNAPKRKFKHAVDRNRLKRLMREAYRKNKHKLSDKMESENATMHIAFSYASDKIESQAFVEKRMIQALSKIEKSADGNGKGEEQ